MSSTRLYADRACVHVAPMAWATRVLLAAVVLLAGCAGSARLDAPPTPLVPAAEAPRTPAETELRLRATADRWMGVPYRWGGTTRSGIDCSAFVRTLYQETFRVPLPRSTRGQVQVGVEVDRDALQTGDLVFFKINRGTNHVGVYLSDGLFVHASSSEGVTVSPLAGYFERRYWTARRLLPRFGAPPRAVPQPAEPVAAPPATPPAARPGW